MSTTLAIRLKVWKILGGPLSSNLSGEEAVPFPEDGYHGEDIKTRAQEFADIHGDAYVDAEEKGAP